ncbi:hypothetical protein J6590_089760 [Homalodisca vitripennis]|nr:hypothetical protein J6590_089760 [Homalodisca vitripennis]
MTLGHNCRLKTQTVLSAQEAAHPVDLTDCTSLGHLHSARLHSSWRQSPYTRSVKANDLASIWDNSIQLAYIHNGGSVHTLIERSSMNWSSVLAGDNSIDLAYIHHRGIVHILVDRTSLNKSVSVNPRYWLSRYKYMDTVSKMSVRELNRVVTG